MVHDLRPQNAVMKRDVLLIHGMWCRGEHLNAVAAPLRDAGYRVHQPTLPFHERRDRADMLEALGRASLLDYADYCQGVIHQLKLSQPPILVGHSMGGLIAQMLAARMPVQALILLTPAAPAGILAVSPRTLRVFWRRLLQWGFWKKPHGLSAEQARQYALNGLSDAQVEQILPTLGLESGRALFEIAFWPLDRRRAAQVDADAVDCPVYVLGCEDDWLTPADTVRKVAARYPQSTLDVDSGRGHWMIDDDRTAQTMARCIEWLDKHLETA